MIINYMQTFKPLTSGLSAEMSTLFFNTASEACLGSILHQFCTDKRKKKLLNN